MMKKIFLTGLFILAGILAFGQGINDVRINELLVRNVDNFEDSYGHREQWVELFNAGHSNIDVGGCYITIDPQRKDMSMTYRIPTGDKRTIMAPQSYLVFFCEGTDTKGTFHTNFTLDQTGYVALLNASGKGDPVDELTYKIEDQEDDISIGRITHDNGELIFTKLTTTTPQATNEKPIEVPAHELFRRMDPSGGVLAITAMSVVFSALIALWLLFSAVGNLMVKIAHKKEAKHKTHKGATHTVKKTKDDMYSGEVVAAISHAIKLYQEELYDKESAILTINRVAKAYSPWSSKIYGLRQLPNRK